MCRFTRLFWTRCGHSTLSDTPEHTELCTRALAPDEEIRPGFDRAPAFCHPLPADIEELGTQYRESARIAQTVCLYTQCETCKDAAGVSGPRGAGTDIELPVETFDEYTDADRADVAMWLDVYVADTNKVDRALLALEARLAADTGAFAAAIHSIRDETIRVALLNPNSPERWSLFRKTYLETARLLLILDNYFVIRMPKKLVNDVLAVLADKFYQADFRLDVFRELVRSLEAAATDPGAHEAAVNMHADKLAMRLGRPAVPDADAFAYMAAEVPRHVRDAVATRETVRRRSIKEHASVLRTDRYAPRRAFGLRRNRNALAIDVGRAWNPPPERRAGLPVLGQTVEVVYEAGLAGYDGRGAMGVGRWGAQNVRAQREVMGTRTELARRDESAESEDTLVVSPDRRTQQSSGGSDGANSDNGTSTGMPLESPDSEVSDVGDVDHRQKADVQDAGRRRTLKTDKDVWGRDADGRLVKKRKRSG